MKKIRKSAQPAKNGNQGHVPKSELKGVNCGDLASSLGRHYDNVARANGSKPRHPSGMIVHGDVGDFGDFEKGKGR